EDDGAESREGGETASAVGALFVERIHEAARKDAGEDGTVVVGEALALHHARDALREREELVAERFLQSLGRIAEHDLLLDLVVGHEREGIEREALRLAEAIRRIDLRVESRGDFLGDALGERRLQAPQQVDRTLERLPLRAVFREHELLLE